MALSPLSFLRSSLAPASDLEASPTGMPTIATRQAPRTPDLTNAMLNVLSGNFGSMLSGGERLSALGALLKSVSRGSQTSPQEVIRGIQQQKLQQVQGALQIQELRKQAVDQAKTEAGLAAFAARLPEEQRAVFDNLPIEERIKVATRQESTGFDPVTGQQVYTSGPRTGQIIPRQVTGQAAESGQGVGKSGDLVTIGGVAGRINEKGVWEPLPQRSKFRVETRMINGKPTQVQVDLATGKIDELSAGTPTEGERTAGFLTMRLQNALNVIDQVARDNPEAAKPTVRGEFTRGLFGDTAANAIASPERQQIEAAQLDALDAALTLGTGAAYTREQLENYRRAYFPQLGDGDATAAAKRKRFAQLVEAARVKAGRSAPPPKQNPAPSAGGIKILKVTPRN